MLRNCPQCGRLLTSAPGTPCAACLREEDEAVTRIQAYLQSGGVPSLAMVAQGTGLKIGLLRRLAHSGRVLLSDGAMAAGVCALCGRDVADRTARVCPECARRLDPRPRGIPPTVGRRPEPKRAAHGGFYSQPVGRDA